MINIIKASLWGKPEYKITVTQEDFDQLVNHSLTAIPAPIFSQFVMSEDLRARWNDLIIKQIAYYAKYVYMQEHLPITVPYVILKGTSAAQYYPHPELRAMGDIDIITHRENYQSACKMLLDNGYIEITSENDREHARQRVFKKDSIIIEMHSFFAYLNDPEKAKYFDNLVIDNIQSSHVLPDVINGLVLIEHINQHLEHGLGLRQIIDWMMFVDKCLPDENWSEFQKYVSNIGLEKLTIVTTRMCEIYLGLSEHQWCKNADSRLSAELMDYILSCGNFGYNLNINKKIAIERSVRLKHPIKLMRELQTLGLQNWKFAQNPVLKPFAWIWQGIHSIKKTPDLLNTHREGRRLDTMFDSLGIKRKHRGLAHFEDGKYIKK